LAERKLYVVRPEPPTMGAIALEAYVFGRACDATALQGAELDALLEEIGARCAEALDAKERVADDGERVSARESDAPRELCDAATPGPWVFSEGFLWNEALDHGVLAHGEIVQWDMTAPNRAFIAASRTLVPRLLDEVERMRPVYEAARACPVTSADGWLMCQLKDGHGGRCQMKDVSLAVVAAAREDET